MATVWDLWAEMNSRHVSLLSLCLVVVFSCLLFPDCQQDWGGRDWASDLGCWLGSASNIRISPEGRIGRRGKKAFLSDQSKEIEENNRKGKTRDLFKKIRDTTGTFHAKMGSIGQKWYGPNKISRRGGKNTQKNCTKKIFTTRTITMVWSLT